MANDDVLSSILAELRDLKASHSNLESRLESLAISIPGTFSPVLGGAHYGGGGGGRRGSAAGTPASNGSIPIKSTIDIGQPVVQPTGPIAPIQFGSSPPIDSNHHQSNTTTTTPHARKGSIDHAAKQEFINYIRNTPPLQPKDAASSTSGSAAQQVLERNIYPSRAVLTTYPGQVGVNPLPLRWAAKTSEERGPILASRQKMSLGLRNAIGAYGGAYSVYHALSVAIGALDPNQRPNYTNTEPIFDIRPNPAWFDEDKIVTIDPWGHLAQVEYRAQIEAGIDIRPTISITKAHLKIAELDDAARAGRLKVDGKIVLPSSAATMASAMAAENSTKLDVSAKDALNAIATDAGIDISVNKVAFEHVWYLPGVAKRLKVSENLLRRSLFEDTGGMYPELLTRQDLKVFLPPIGGGTCYIFGPPEYLSDPTKKLAVRVHDACSGSDIFGSDICTCRPYLLHGMEEAIKCAQDGGVGLIVYFQKEGRALGEVTKYLVYNARKRGGDSASQYFARTENIAGVKDMRFQAFMPDILHFLGVQKIDELYSMSDMKYDAIVGSGISVDKRLDLPSDLVPLDGMVEIQAKINAGYFSSKGPVTAEDLTKTVGRAWEDLEH